MYRKIAANIASAALAIAVSALFFANVFFPEDASLQGSKSTAPEWYWHKAHIVTFNEEGMQTQVARADEIRYFKDEDIAYLTAPRLTSYTEETDPPWHSRADFGKFKEKYDVIELYQNVDIQQGDGEVTITTERLVLTRSKHLAETDLPVTIIGETSRTDAVGMRAWLDEEKVELLAKVRTVHEPQ